MTTQATMASMEITQVKFDPRPSEAPGLRTSVNDSRPSMTRIEWPLDNADNAHSLLI